MPRNFISLGAILFLAACGSGSERPVSLEDRLAKPEGALRVATFNVSLYREREGQLVDDFLSGEDEQIAAIAEIIIKVDPDILVLTEIDYNNDYIPLGVLRDNYLTPPADEDGLKPLIYPHIRMYESNSGLNPGTVDFDNNGEVVTAPGRPGYAGDSFGYGQFPGQYGFAIISRYPLIDEFSRSFKQFAWRDMPENLMPTEYYSEAAQAAMRLSSKNHIDQVVRVGDQYIHLLIMHPTPPTFDGDEDRNGRRNYDEIRFFADYVTPADGDYIYDDAWIRTDGAEGRKGGLAEGERFIILGDFNADPADGDSVSGAVGQLLDHPQIVDPAPGSNGAWQATAYQGRINDNHAGDHAQDTADFSDSGEFAAGNLRLDYVLPSANGLEVVNSGVFWPSADEEGYDLVGPGYPPVSSDHRLVWVDLRITD